MLGLSRRCFPEGELLLGDLDQRAIREDALLSPVRVEVLEGLVWEHNLPPSVRVVLLWGGRG